MRGVVALLLLLSLVACARHHVIERNQGRVDGERSIASTSDPEWTVLREPRSDEAR